MDEIQRLGESASHWSALSVAVLLLLGIADVVVFFLEFKEHGWSRAAKVEVVALVLLIGLGLVDWKLRAVEAARAELMERAVLDRAISPAAHDKAAGLLRQHPGKLQMRCLGQATRETADYCDAIQKLFIDSGWEVSRGDTAVYANAGGSQISGVRLTWLNGDRPAEVDAVITALSVIDAHAVVEQGPQGMGAPGVTFLLVAQKSAVGK